jgi:Na+/citrate or Na+/malate symporter
MVISDEIIKVLDYLANKLGVTINWTDKNVLPYVEQLCQKYIRYRIANAVMWLVVGVILLIIAALFIRLAFICLKRFKKAPLENWDELTWIFGTIALFPLCFGIGFILVNIHTIIRCVYIPEIELVEYIQTLIK